MELLGSFLRLILKKTTPKNLLYFRKWNFLAPRLKKFLYFRKYMNFLASYFSYVLRRKFTSSKKYKKRRSENISYIFSKSSIRYISRDRTFSYFLKNFFLLFWKTKPSITKLKTLLIYQEGTGKAWKLKFKIFVCWERTLQKKARKKKLAKFLKLNNFLIIIIKRFFLFHNIFFP